MIRSAFDNKLTTFMSLLNLCGIDKVYVQCMKKNRALLSGKMLQTVECTNNIGI